jgi:hypothetical protein
LETQGFRFSFTPLPGSFSPFLHSTMHYRSLTVFSLGGWSPLLPTGFPVSRGTLVQPGLLAISPTRLSRSLDGFPKTIRLSLAVPCGCPQPRHAMHPGLGSLPFARRYLGDRGFFLFLRLLRCFSSPAYLPHTMDSCADAWSLSMRVAPFGYLRIKRYVPLPEAFRSLSRPSSAVSARASALRPFCLTLPWPLFSPLNFAMRFSLSR